MSLVALGLAVLGASVVLVGFYIAGKMENKIWTNVIQILSLILGFITLVVFPVPVEAAESAGLYWLIILIACAVGKKVFFKKKSSVDESV